MSTGQASDTARWNFEGNLVHIFSEEYRKFSVKYRFKHSTSSPCHSKDNRRAEAAIKVAESLLKRADDFHSAMLIYRNKQPQGLTYAPALRMLLQHARTTLPTTD